MNALFLLLGGAVMLALGYRFFSKWVALALFRLDPTYYSTPAYARSDGNDYVAGNRHVLLVQQFALVAGATTVSGVVIATFWGWIPAFLWVLVGATVAGGVYAVGSLWLGVYHGDPPPTAIAAALLGRRAQIPFFVLASVLLLLLNSVLAWLAAGLLVAHPAAVLPFWGQVLFALGLGRALNPQRPGPLLTSTVLAIGITFVAFWLLGQTAVAFTGALNIDLRGHTLISIDAAFTWMVLLFVAATYAARLPVWGLLQPRAYLTGLYAVMLLALLFVSAAVSHPPITAPTFNPASTRPGVIPWLFVTLTSGAIAGFYLLFATGITAKQLVRVTDARYVGYGSVLGEAALALSVIVVCATGFETQAQWHQYYVSWDGIQSSSQVLELYVRGFANLAAALHINPEFARTFAAFVLAGLIAATIDAGVRVQKQLLLELGTFYRIPRLARERVALVLTLALTAVLAFHDGSGQGGLTWWPLFGTWNQALATIGLLLLALAVRRHGGPAIYLLVPAATLFALTLWGLAIELGQWWLAGNWMLVAGGCLLLLLLVWLAGEAFYSWRQSPPPADA